MMKIIVAIAGVALTLHGCKNKKGGEPTTSASGGGGGKPPGGKTTPTPENPHPTPDADPASWKPKWMHFKMQDDAISCGRHALNEALQILGGQMGGEVGAGKKFTANPDWTTKEPVFATNDALKTYDTTKHDQCPVLTQAQMIAGNYFTDQALEKALFELSEGGLSLIQVNKVGEDFGGIKLPDVEPGIFECHIWLLGNMHHWTMYYRQPEVDTTESGVNDADLKNSKLKKHAGWYKVDSISKNFSKFHDYAAFKKFIDHPVESMHVLRVVANPAKPQLVDRFSRTIPKLPAAIPWRSGFDIAA